ncbi:MAG TPA: HXXEE domain-containing protein [Nannocystis sp.]
MPTSARPEAIDYGWPYAGLALAAVLLAVLFLRRSPVGQPYAARFRDPAWLVWAAVPMYMLHQFEEHGVDLLGRRYHFQQTMCATLGYQDLVACPCDPAFILAVNVPLAWIAGPFYGSLARRFPYLGAAILCTPVINALAHIVPALLRAEYNPGLLTAVVLFVPYCAYALRELRRQGVLDRPRLASIPLLGLAQHAVLLASLKAVEADRIGPTVRDLIQVANPFLPLVAAAALNRLLRGRVSARG